MSRPAIHGITTAKTPLLRDVAAVGVGGTVKSRLHHALKTLRENEHTRWYFDEV